MSAMTCQARQSQESPRGINDREDCLNDAIPMARACEPAIDMINNQLFKTFTSWSTTVYMSAASKSLHGPMTFKQLFFGWSQIVVSAKWH